MPVTLLARFPSVLIVNTALPVKNVGDLIALAKKEPGKLNYASVGVGSPQHLAMEQLKADAGIEMTHVPYRGGAAATQAISTGEVNAFWIATSVALPFIQANTVRAIAVGDRERTKTLPDVPTVDESGIKGYEYMPTLALFAPKGTPADVVAYLNREFTAFAEGSRGDQAPRRCRTGRALLDGRGVAVLARGRGQEARPAGEEAQHRRELTSWQRPLRPLRRKPIRRWSRRAPR